MAKSKSADSESGKPQVRIAAHVVIQLGQELVTDVEQAFLELAKNAYDADSETCSIEIDPTWSIEPSHPAFELLSPRLKTAAKNRGAKGSLPVGRVIIEDTGVGASAEDVRTGWLTISASLKRPRTGPKEETTKGRTPVGDKGLGRLATMKIGDVLQFTTNTAGERSSRSTAFAWNQFESVRTIDQVKVLQYESPRKAPFTQGSRVEIIGLHDPGQWNKESVTQLIARLSSLVNPYVKFQDFDITVRCGKDLYDLQQIGSEVLNFAAASFNFKWDGSKLTKRAKISRGLFRGSVGEEARAKFEHLFSEENLPKLKQRLKESRRFKSRGLSIDHPPRGWLFECKEEDEQVSFAARTENPGPFTAEIHYFMFNEEFTNRIQGNAQSAEQVRQMAGLLVFRDGFRVRVGDDWLGLSEGTTTGGFYNLRPKNTLGYFSLSNKGNPQLVEKSDREGFVENSALRGFMRLAQDCKKYANGVLDAARAEVNDFHRSLVLKDVDASSPRAARARLVQTRKHASAEMAKVKDVASHALRQIEALRGSGSSTSKRSELDKAVVSLENAFSRINEGLADLQSQVVELDRTSEVVDSFRQDEAARNLRLLESASVGLSARNLSHELHSYTNQFEEGVRAIVTANRTIGSTEIKKATGDLLSVVRELRKAVAALDPLLPGARTIRERLRVSEIITEFARARAAFAASKGVTINVKGGETVLTIKFSRTRLFQILENLFQNSVYWLSNSPQDAAHTKVISISLHDNGFDWWDSGPGVAENYEDILFDAFVSNKAGSSGQGLGLYIVTTFLEAEKCGIELLSVRNSSGRRYKFRVDLDGARSA